MSDSPTDEELEKKIQELVSTVDLQTTGLKQFIQILSQQFGGVNLKSRKGFIKQALTEAIENMEKKDGGDSEEEEESSESESEEEEMESTPRKSKKGGGGLAAKKEISTELANFLGEGTHMARTAIVKSLWKYIRDNNLQNPNNKKEILLDEKMQSVFGCKSFTMFTMNKYIGAHIHPFKPVDLTSPSSSSKSRSPRKRRAAAKSPKKSPGAKKPRKAGTQPPYQLSPELEAVVGKSILPRPQVVSAVWVYIKANNLQNPQDKREIICDEKLAAVMKKKKVTMFTMNQLITPHLLEKLDRSSYQHDSDDE